MKLSTKQKEVIKLMREGWSAELGKFSKKPYLHILNPNSNNTLFKDIHASSFNGLVNKRLIKEKGNRLERGEYDLTDEGRTINID